MVNDTTTLDPVGIPLHYGYGQAYQVLWRVFVLENMP